MHKKTEQNNHSQHKNCDCNFCDQPNHDIFNSTHKTFPKTIDVYGIGNPLLDVLIKIDEKTISELGASRGGGVLVDEDTLGRIEFQINEKHVEQEKVLMLGGSVANTTAGVVMLGGKAGFCGKVGDDEYGELYINKTKECGVTTDIVISEGRTAQAITLITPDAERSFIVHLGVAGKLSHTDIIQDHIARAKFLHVSGYVLEPKESRKACIQAMEYAKLHGVKISIDLSEKNLVTRMKDALEWILKTYADIVFANEDEAKAFTGKDPEDALEELSNIVDIAIVKIGKEGSIIKTNKDKKKIRIKSFLVEAVDATGAGDMYAAGVLYGLSQEFDLKSSALIGSYAASKIVQIVGARLPEQMAKGLVNDIKTKKEIFI